MAITKNINTRIAVDDCRNKVTYEGLSTDSKPTTNVGTNDEFRELDTGKWYYYDGSAWQEGVGGGSSGSNGTVIVPVTNVYVGNDGSINGNYDTSAYNLPELFDEGKLIYVSLTYDFMQMGDVQTIVLPLWIKLSSSMLSGMTSYYQNGLAMLSYYTTQGAGAFSGDIMTS